MSIYSMDNLCAGTKVTWVYNPGFVYIVMGVDEQNKTADLRLAKKHWKGTKVPALLLARPSNQISFY